MRIYRIRRTDTYECFNGYDRDDDPVWAKVGKWYALRDEAEAAVAELLHHREFCAKYTPDHMEAIDRLYPADIGVVEYSVNEIPPTPE